MSAPSLRERVAEALYNEPTKSPMNRVPWERLDADRQAAWLDDADRVIPLVLDFTADALGNCCADPNVPRLVRNIYPRQTRPRP